MLAQIKQLDRQFASALMTMKQRLSPEAALAAVMWPVMGFVAVTPLQSGVANQF